MADPSLFGTFAPPLDDPVQQAALSRMFAAGGPMFGQLDAGPLARVGPLSQQQTEAARALINTTRIPGQNGGPSLEPVEHTWQEGRTPSFAEALSGGIQTGLRAAGMDTYDARHFGNAATSLGSLFPPVGIPMAADELYSAAQNRDLFGGALASIGLLPMAKGALTAAKGAARTFPIAETAARQEQRLAAGYPHVVEVDAGGFKNAFERDQKTPLVWNQEKLDRLQNITPDAYPFAYISNGKVSVDDGAHRIGLAAQRGESIPVAVPDEATGQQLLGRIGSNDAAPPVPAIRAYHGSPHDFERFSLDKIGTGEGAQAYGHGLYFAEGEDVAKSYRDALSKTVVSHPQLGDDIGFMKLDTSFANAAKRASPNIDMRYADQVGANMTEALRNGDSIADFRKFVSKSDWSNAQKDAWYGALDHAAEFKLTPRTGHMYEVNIKADPEHFLDWDKPLSEQSHIVDAVKASPAYQRLAASRHFGYSPEEFAALSPERQAGLIAKTPPSIHENILSPDRPGRGLYDSLGNQVEASQALRDAGIPGIRYLDQGSRGAGNGTRNYVAFDDRMIDIIRKYGIAGLMGGGIAAGAIGSNFGSLDGRPVQ